VLNSSFYRFWWRKDLFLAGWVSWRKFTVNDCEIGTVNLRAFSGLEIWQCWNIGHINDTSPQHHNSCLFDNNSHVNSVFVFICCHLIFIWNTVNTPALISTTCWTLVSFLKSQFCWWFVVSKVTLPWNGRYISLKGHKRYSVYICSFHYPRRWKTGSLLTVN